MLTIKIPSAKDLVARVANLAIDAREFRFWDKYYSINKGEYAKKQRDIYLTKVDAQLKKMHLTNADRLIVIKELLETKEIL
jgi:hypothetical protein